MSYFLFFLTSLDQYLQYLLFSEKYINMPKIHLENSEQP